MVDIIIKGVCNALSKKFADAEIYRDTVEQGFCCPCFCVDIKSVRDELFRDRRYKFALYIEIRFYGEELHDYRSRAIDSVSLVETEGLGLVRGSDISAVSSDDGFVVDVLYEFFYVKDAEVQVMNSIKLSYKLS